MFRKLFDWLADKQEWKALAEQRLRDSQENYRKYRHWSKLVHEAAEDCGNVRRGISVALAMIKRFEGRPDHAMMQLIIMQLTNNTGVDYSDPICRGQETGHEGYDIASQMCLCCGDTRRMMAQSRHRRETGASRELVESL